MAALKQHVDRFGEPDEDDGTERDHIHFLLKNVIQERTSAAQADQSQQSRQLYFLTKERKRQRQEAQKFQNEARAAKGRAEQLQRENDAMA